MLTSVFLKVASIFLLKMKPLEHPNQIMCCGDKAWVDSVLSQSLVKKKKDFFFFPSLFHQVQLSAFRLCSSVAGNYTWHPGSSGMYN